ncbi:MAG: acetate--CoA ligase family protein [Microthrixaceae bacterium]
MSRTLSEADSKAFLSEFSIPFAPEVLVSSADQAVEAANSVGLPVAVKLCGDNISHKTERGLVRLALADSASVHDAASALLEAAVPEDHATGVLVAPMISGSRELIAGITQDAQFGPTILIGIGGILAEAIADVAVRLLPITEVDAEEMIEQLQMQSLLGEFRGDPAVDRRAVVEILLSLSQIAVQHPEVLSIDLNPLIISQGQPIAVDALVEVKP